MDIRAFGGLDLSFGREDLSFETLGASSAVDEVTFGLGGVSSAVDVFGSGAVSSLSPGVSSSVLPGVKEDATGSPVLGSPDLPSPTSR